MSLVICSNQDSDATSERQKSSIYEAWSFKNQLTSTYKIPAESQVALQSCKVNIDGRVVASQANSKFYQYFGTKLDLDGTTSPQIDDTTSYPVLTSAVGMTERNIKELSSEDFANTLQSGLRETTFHPNQKKQTTVDVLRNASNLDFLGYKITYNQTNASTNNVPADNALTQYYSTEAGYEPDGDGNFSYTGGVFTRTGGTAEPLSAVGISPELPMSLTNGELVVNISGTSGRANASGVPWVVGLSRYLNNTNDDGYYYPPYADYPEADLGLEDLDIFCDFAVARNAADQLICFHTMWKGNYIEPVEVDYWRNASSYFAGGDRFDMNGSDLEEVRFTANGENMKAEIYDNASGAWRVITEYKSTEPVTSYFKPIAQTNWCLHPVLAVGFTQTIPGGPITNASCSLRITKFNAASWVTDYDPTTMFKGGWYETLELANKLSLCRQVDKRAILTYNNTESYTPIGLNASNKVDYDNVLVLLPSEIYTQTPEANAKELLGYNRSIVDTPTSEPFPGNQIFQSDFAPSIVSSLSLFVRLDNFNQSVKNARVGNQSKILAHLTELETTTGRQTYEPSNLVWLDLGNPSEISVTEFGISFCYVNEQYATVLTGQSIVCLYFRKKPKDLM